MVTNKTLSLFALSIFTVVVLMSAVSAVTIFSDNFNDGDLVGWTVVNNSAPGGSPWSNTGTFAEATPGASATDGTSTLSRTISTSGFQDIVVKYDRELGSDLETDDNIVVSWSTDGVTFTTLESVNMPGTGVFVSKTFNLPSSANNNASFQLKFECTTDAQTDEFCRIDNVIVEGVSTPTEILDCSAVGNPGVLQVKKIDFTNNGHSYSSFGKDDEWFPLEEIEVEIEIENDGNYDVDDVEVSWGLYDTSRNEWVIDFDEEDTFNIKDGDEERLVVDFVLDNDLDVDLEDLNDGDNYRLYVTAFGTIDDNDSPNDGEDTCASDFEITSMVIESDFVIITDVELPEILQCGETATVTAEVWNIGDRDQDEVSVEVSGRENALNFNSVVEAGDIDAFDNQEITFTFKVPTNLEEKLYALQFEVLDEDDDIYENDFDDDKASFTVPFEVRGNCGVLSGLESLSISANMVSDQARAGEELVIRVTINNLGDSETFTVNAADFSSWASSAQVDRPTVIINEGQSEDVLLTFDVNNDARGSYNFFIEVVSSDNKVTKQPVSVVIEPKSAFGFTGNLIGEGNGFLWTLGFINVILVVIIILVAVKVARR